MVRSPLRVDENRRQPGRQSVDALTGAAIDILARQRRQHEVAVAILAGRPAQRAGQRRAAAKPRDGDGRVRRAAAIDDEKVFRLDLAVRLRKIFDAKNLVEHDDAGAQDSRRASRRPFAPASHQPKTF